MMFGNNPFVIMCLMLRGVASQITKHHFFENSQPLTYKEKKENVLQE